MGGSLIPGLGSLIKETIEKEAKPAAKAIASTIKEKAPAWIQRYKEMFSVEGIANSLEGHPNAQSAVRGIATNLGHEAPKPLPKASPKPGGTTLLDKLFPGAQAEWVERPDGSPGIRLGGASPRGWKIMGGSLYGGRRGTGIPTKELMQNAYDSIRGIAGGEVKIVVNGPMHRIEVHDNGKGMNLTTMATKLVDLFESGKAEEEGAAGGFGIAKASIFTMPKRVKAISVSEVDKGRFQVTTLEGEFEQLLKPEGVGLRHPDKANWKDMDIIGDDGYYSSYLTSKPPFRGTRMYLQYNPDEYFDDYAALNFVKDSAKSIDPPGKLFIAEPTRDTHPYKLIQSDPGGDVSKDKWMHVPMAGYEHKYSPVEIEGKKPTELMYRWDLPHAIVDLYRSPIDAGEKFTSTLVKALTGMKSDVNVEINNNGIYQISKSIGAGWGKRLTGVPDRIAVNIKSKVSEESPLYPFTSNRENIKDDIWQLIQDKIQQDIVKPAVKKGTQVQQDVFNEMVSNKVGGAPLYDAGGRLTADELKWFNDNSFFKDFSSTLREVWQDLAKHLSNNMEAGKVGHKSIEFGIVFSNKIHGVSIPNPTNPDKKVLLLNPFSYSDVDTPEGTVSGMFETMLHELNHDYTTGHGEDFTSNMNRIMRSLGYVKGFEFQDKLETILRSSGKGNFKDDWWKAKDLYDARRNRTDTIPDLFKVDEQAIAKRYKENPRGQKIPVFTREDLEEMGAGRKDAMLNEIWPTSGKPKEDVFYFDMGNGEFRPSKLIRK